MKTFSLSPPTLCVHAARAVLARDIGSAIARLHNADIIHGDLTTSNLMLRSSPALAAVPLSGGGRAAALHGAELSDARVGAPAAGGASSTLDASGAEDTSQGAAYRGALLGGAGAASAAQSTESCVPLAAAQPQPQFAVVLIDFGLACGSLAAEDKAVDLYVLERAIISAHSTLAEEESPPGGESEEDEEGGDDHTAAASARGAAGCATAVASDAAAGTAAGFFEHILASYLLLVRDATEIARRFALARRRGRKRLAFG